MLITGKKKVNKLNLKHYISIEIISHFVPISIITNMSKVHNFSAGPCILPNKVFQKSAESILNFNNSGLSLIEISHRSKDFVEVMEEARKLVKEILKFRNSRCTFFTRWSKLGILNVCIQFNGNA